MKNNNSLKMFEFLFLCVLCILTIVTTGLRAAAPPAPNVLLIVSEDN